MAMGAAVFADDNSFTLLGYAEADAENCFEFDGELVLNFGHDGHDDVAAIARGADAGGVRVLRFIVAAGEGIGVVECVVCVGEWREHVEMGGEHPYVEYGKEMTFD